MVIVSSPHLLAELEEALCREKFRRYLTREEALQAVAHLRTVVEMHVDAPHKPGLTPDPDDDYLIALARSAGADVLVSGDRHLTSLPALEFPVLSPAAFLARFQPAGF